MTTYDWHADDDTLRALRDSTVGPVLGASVETHLIRCGDCRDRLTHLTDPAPLDDIWLTVRESIESQGAGPIERLIRRLGLSGEASRLLSAVPALRGAWLLGVTTALLFCGLAAAFAGHLGLSLFLLVAPLAPVAGVAAAYGGDGDPSHELVTTTPYSAGRLLCLRTAAVLISTAPAAILAGLALPGAAWLALAWLAPAAAGIALALLAAPVVGMTAATTIIAVGWATVVGTLTRLHDPIALVEPVMQAVFLAVTAAATALLLARYRALDLPGRQ